MKKLVVLLFLFYAKTLCAQQLYLGGSLGLGDYVFRQQTYYGGQLDFPFGFTAQYILKGNMFGDEINLLYEPFGPNPSHQDTGSGIIPDFTAVDYITFIPFQNPKGVAALQIKAGFFYSHYFVNYLFPQNDYGPAIALDVYFKTSKKDYFGIEVSKFYGLSNYFVYENQNLFQFFFSSSANPSGNSNITYTIFSIKFLHQIE